VMSLLLTSWERVSSSFHAISASSMRGTRHFMKASWSP
jgi:hypothetical protein